MDRRDIRWVAAARRDFLEFPAAVQRDMNNALMEIGNGEMPAKAKALRGLGPGVLEIALKHSKGAWRLVYALKIGNDIWIIHAFQKKSKSGIATPQKDIETIKTRLKHLREATQMNL